MMKKKRFFRSKEQILFEKEQAKHKAIMTKFIDERLMPFMNENTQNLEEAQFLTESLKVAINQAFQMQAKTMKLGELHMPDQLAKVKKPEAVKKHIGLLRVLEDQPVQDAITLLGAIYEETGRVVLQSMKEKKLSDFQKQEVKKDGN